MQRVQQGVRHIDTQTHTKTGTDLMAEGAARSLTHWHTQKQTHTWWQRVQQWVWHTEFQQQGPHGLLKVQQVLVTSDTASAKTATATLRRVKVCCRRTMYKKKVYVPQSDPVWLTGCYNPKFTTCNEFKSYLWTKGMLNYECSLYK